MVDLAALVYLNPEIVFNNIEQLRNRYNQGEFNELIWNMPTLPSAFNPVVYVATIHDLNISRINKDINNNSYKANAFNDYIGSLMLDVIKTNGFHFRLSHVDNSFYTISENHLSIGDHVKLMHYSMNNQVTGGSGNDFELEGIIQNIDADRRGFTLENTFNPRRFRSKQQFVLYGIKIWDVRRLAIIAYTRDDSVVLNTMDGTKTIPIEDFNESLYKTLYPESQHINRESAYLEYRQRWIRSNAYRISKGSDIANLAIPMNQISPNDVASNLTSTDLTIHNTLRTGAMTANPSGTIFQGDFDVYDTNGNILIENGSNELKLGPLIVTNDNNIILQSQFNDLNPLQIYQDRMDIAGSTLVIHNNSNLYINATSTTITNTLGIGMSIESSKQNMSNIPIEGETKLAVDGNIYATGSVITLSDEREKEDIKIINNSLDKVKQLTGYTYTMKGNRSTGLMAQDVKKVLPEAVFTIGNKETVAYGNIIGLLVNAINEISQKIV